MLVHAMLAVGVLALGSQVVFALDFRHLNFSTIDQCGSFWVNFTGGVNAITPSDLPLSLSVVPFNSSFTSVLSIPLPDSTLDNRTDASSGAAISFIPLAAGTQFVASLDNSSGTATALVSDIIAIQQSSNTSCLPAATVNYASRFSFNRSELLQCESFNVTFDPKVIQQPPTVRALEPFGRAFTLNVTNQTSGSASYLMQAFRGRQLVLQFNDGNSHVETTELLSIGGNSSSSNGCFPASLTQQPQEQNAARSPVLSRGAIIGIGAGGGGAILLLSILMFLYAQRERRRRKLHSMGLRGWVEAKPSLPPLPPMPPSKSPLNWARLRPRSLSPSSRIIKDAAPYGLDASATPMSTDFFRVSRTTYPNSPDSAYGKSDTVVLSPMRRLPPSVNSFDIEKILDMATVYSAESRRASAESLPVTKRPSVDFNPAMMVRSRDAPPPESTASATLRNPPGRGPAERDVPQQLSPLQLGGKNLLSPRPAFMRGHDRDPSDVPADPTYSMYFGSQRSASPPPPASVATPASAPTQGASSHSPPRASMSTVAQRTMSTDSSGSAFGARSQTGTTPPLFTSYLGGISETLGLPSSVNTQGSFGDVGHPPNPPNPPNPPSLPQPVAQGPSSFKNPDGAERSPDRGSRTFTFFAQ